MRRERRDAAIEGASGSGTGCSREQAAQKRALQFGENNRTGGVQAQGAIPWMAHFASRTRCDAAHDRDAPVLDTLSWVLDTLVGVVCTGGPVLDRAQVAVGDAVDGTFRLGRLAMAAIAVGINMSEAVGRILVLSD